MPYYAVKNRILNETTATGTADIAISGFVAGYQSLVGSELDNAGVSIFPYIIEGVSGACLGQVAIGYGTMNTGTLERDASEFSLVGGSQVAGPVDFLAGTKRVYVAPTENELVYLHDLSSGMDTSRLSRQVSIPETPTTDATPTVLAGSIIFGAGVYSAPTGTTFDFDAGWDGAYTFDLIVNATKVATNDAAAWRVTCLVTITAGVVALVGSPAPSAIAATAGAAAWDLDLGVSSNSLTLTATGAAASNISWTGIGVATGTVA